MSGRNCEIEIVSHNLPAGCGAWNDDGEALNGTLGYSMCVAALGQACVRAEIRPHRAGGGHARYEVTAGSSPGRVFGRPSS